jgi:hypothetical protein
VTVLPSKTILRARWHHASFIAGFLLPLLVSALYTYFAAREAFSGDTSVSPVYPSVLGLALALPPMLLGAIVLSYLCKRPRPPHLRLLAGLFAGSVLFYGGQRDWFVF